MARNYGISMLLLFMLATCYKKHRHQGIVLGVLLFLLANCNVHSVILSAAFLMFWFFDTIFEKINQKKFLKIFAINALIAFLGVLVCFLTVYPTFNDAARLGSGIPDVITFKSLASAIVFPGFTFFIPPSLLEFPQEFYYKWPATLLLYGSPLILIKRPSAMAAIWTVMILFSCFFSFIYPSHYRHQVLWLVFFISMYWINCEDKSHEQGNGIFLIDVTEKIGYVLFVLLILMQVSNTFSHTLPRLLSNVPESRSRDFGLLIKNKPELKHAIMISDYEDKMESLPYYVNNPTYLLREQRFGHTAHYTKRAIEQLTLNDILNNAHMLKNNFHKPVLILMSSKLNTTELQTTNKNLNWTLSSTPEQVNQFLSETDLLAKFKPLTATEEYYDVYLLK